MTIEDYFDKIFVINLDKRPDRWAHCLEQFRKFNLTKVERFSGFSDVNRSISYNEDGTLWRSEPISGNKGCTSSHRSLLDIIAYHGWNRVLVLEDDFEIEHSDFHSRFESMLPEVPQDWDMLYLGGHFANAPQRRISKHVIKFSRMLTTSSYGITAKFARLLAPHICGEGPIDSLYSGFTPAYNCYIFQPRLIVQYSSFSDITERDSTNAPCMQDTRHENMV